MFDDIELTDCPEEYALNCKNYEIKCHECKANSAGKYLQYKPIDKTLNAHPCSIKKKKKGVVSYSRRGRAEEKKLIEKDHLLKANYLSGMIGGDGDAHIDLYNIGRIRVEIKFRFTENGKRYPSAKEYREAGTQNIGIILINLTVGRTRETYAYMTFKLFTTIWRVLLFHQDLRVYSNPYSYGEIYEFYKMRSVPMGCDAAKQSFFLGEDQFSNTTMKKEAMIRYSRMVVYKNDYGQYVAMHGDTLSSLIDLYKYVTLDE